MQILTDKVEKNIQENLIKKKNWKTIPKILKTLYANIPEKKRISYGIVHTIKTLSKYLSENLPDPFKSAQEIFQESDDSNTKGVALGILGNFEIEKVSHYFKSAAKSDDWQLRELSQLFFRKVIKNYPEKSRRFLLKLSLSKDENLRRFVAETLRPVRENQWFYKTPDYSLSILKNLFAESRAYPRTAVGNNLSDLARRLPELVYSLIEELVFSKDKNSYWIAYRACRNLVKKEPIRVMDLLGVNKYRYKKRIHERESSQRQKGTK